MFYHPFLDSQTWAHPHVSGYFKNEKFLSVYIKKKMTFLHRTVWTRALNQNSCVCYVVYSTFKPVCLLWTLKNFATSCHHHLCGQSPYTLHWLICRRVCVEWRYVVNFVSCLFWCFLCLSPFQNMTPFKCATKTDSTQIPFIFVFCLTHIIYFCLNSSRKVFSHCRQAGDSD